jgi:acetyltransferase-like isoleucine patch superfamily enzyme
MRIGVFGACREGLDCLRTLKGSRIFEPDSYFFIDNDERVVGSYLENCCIYHPKEILELKLDLLVVAVIDVNKVAQQVRGEGYTGTIKNFYGDQYFSDKERRIGMGKIGKFSYYKPSTFLYNVQIGNYCHIGADCRLGLSGHDPENLTTYPLRLKSLRHKFKWEGENQKRQSPLIIEDDVYIGEGVSILAGITIGRGSIVGSKSMVTSSVDPYSVVGGAPARVIGSRLNADLKVILNKSGWVDMEIDAAIEALERIGVPNVQ